MVWIVTKIIRFRAHNFEEKAEGEDYKGPIEREYKERAENLTLREVHRVRTKEKRLPPCTKKLLCCVSKS